MLSSRVAFKADFSSKEITKAHPIEKKIMPSTEVMFLTRVRSSGRGLIVLEFSHTSFMIRSSMPSSILFFQSYLSVNRDAFTAHARSWRTISNATAIRDTQVRNLLRLLIFIFALFFFAFFSFSFFLSNSCEKGQIS